MSESIEDAVKSQDPMRVHAAIREFERKGRRADRIFVGIIYALALGILAALDRWAQ